MQNLTVIGAGWLGLPLAQYLMTIGHSVMATRTNESGVQHTKSLGVDALSADLNTTVSELELHLTRHPQQILIGCFPPGFRRQHSGNYVNQWRNLVDVAKRAGVKKLVMVSSTSVYPSGSEEMLEQNASYTLALNNPLFSDKARALLEAEQEVINSGLEYAIVRCSGLIGPNRHPSRFVSKMAKISRSAPANILHLQDAIGCISFAALNITNQVVNASTPNTVSKAEFYQHALNSVQDATPLPTIVDEPDKRIVSDKIIQLGYKFHYQHTLESL